MINAGKLLQQFLGQSPSSQANSSATGTGLNLPGGSFTSGALAGGLVGLLVSNKKVRKLAGGVAGYGGAAAVGALAFKAYQNWQQGRSVDSAPIAAEQDLHQVDARFRLPQPVDSDATQMFGLVLIKAMIVAANADGHIDTTEQARIFEQVEALDLDAESKAWVFDTLRKPPGMDALVSSVQGVEQAAEVYLVSRLIAAGDNPAEKAYLQALAHRLQLPGDLVAHLDHQVTVT